MTDSCNRKNHHSKVTLAVEMTATVAKTKTTCAHDWFMVHVIQQSPQSINLLHCARYIRDIFMRDTRNNEIAINRLSERREITPYVIDLENQCYFVAFRCRKISIYLFNFMDTYTQAH